MFCTAFRFIRNSGYLFGWYLLKPFFVSIYKYSNFFYFIICVDSYNSGLFIKMIVVGLLIWFYEYNRRIVNGIPNIVSAAIIIDLKYITNCIFHIIQTFDIRISCVSTIYVKIPSTLPLSGEGPFVTFGSGASLLSLLPVKLHVLI